MKTNSISYLAILLLWICLVACQKEDDIQVNPQSKISGNEPAHSSTRTDANGKQEIKLFPAPVLKATFWTCALGCERSFAMVAAQITLDELSALKDINPVRQKLRLQQIAQRKKAARDALYICLSNCVATYGAPPSMCVPPCERYSSGPFIYCPSREPFSLQRYHQLLVDCYLS